MPPVTDPPTPGETPSDSPHEALRASEARFRHLAESSPLGIFVTDHAGDCTWANPRLAAIFELTPAELLGRGYVRRTHPDDLDRVRGEWLTALMKRERLDTEYRLLLPGAGVRLARFWCAPMLDAGRFLGMVGSVLDDTERVALERRLRQSEKMESLGTMAGGIAHDFNNMLGIVMGHAELALLEAEDQPSLKDSLEAIRTASLRARDLVRQILTFSRRSDAAMAPLDARTVVAESLRLVRATLPASVVLELDLPASPVIVSADATALQQVLINLCMNAEQALRTQGGGRIEVALGVRDDAAVLAVRDDGPGMPQAVRERAFEPFFTTKPVGEGTGMGLAVVDGIVAAHRGAIRLEDAAPGLRVEISLPLSEAAPAAPATPLFGRSGAGRVLLVEDEPGLRAVVPRTLELAGYEVTPCTDGEDALARLGRDAGHDLVLSDVSMPRLGGEQLAREIHARYPTLPIVLMTGYARGVSLDQARAEGVVAILHKPMTARDLVNAIGEALGR